MAVKKGEDLVGVSVRVPRDVADTMRGLVAVRMRKDPCATMRGLVESLVMKEAKRVRKTGVQFGRVKRIKTGRRPNK